MIINPVSGAGKGLALGQAAAGVLIEKGHSVSLIPTERAGHAAELCDGQEFAGADAVLVAGGDGTLHEVINILRSKPKPLGIFPLGTGNVLAKELRLGKELKAMLKPILAWKVRKIDLCQIEGGRCFVCMLSAGIDGRIVQLLEARRTGRTMKMYEYIPLSTQALREANYRNLHISIGGKEVEEKQNYCVLANTHSFGGPLEMVSQACCDDGFMDVLSASFNVRRYYVPMIAMAFFKQLMRFPGVKIRRVKDAVLRVQGGSPVPYQLDGEFGGLIEPGKSLEVKLLPQALEVFCS